MRDYTKRLKKAAKATNDGYWIGDDSAVIVRQCDLKAVLDDLATLDHLIDRLYDAVERKVKVAPTMGGSMQEDIHRGVMLTMDRVLKAWRAERVAQDDTR